MEGVHSEWFCHELHPVRPGVYQRDYGEDGANDLCFCYFDGDGWFAYCDSIEEAAMDVRRSHVQAPWRGLTLEEFTQRHRDHSRALERIIWDAMP